MTLQNTDPNEEALTTREEKLQARLDRVKALEKEILAREKKVKEKDKEKKQVLLRLAPSLWQEIANWATDDFRSINGQIEYLLASCVEKRKKGNF